jgi:hypothetical protein
MLRLRFSPGSHPPGQWPGEGHVWSPGEVDISGTAADLSRVRERVLSFLRSSEDTLLLSDIEQEFDPRPYAQAIAVFEIRKTSGPTKVSTDGASVVRVEGASENIERFMSWFNAPPDASSGWHQHYDCMDGSPCVAKDCLDVVVGVR